MAAYLPLEVQRNGSFGCTLTFTDGEGEALDLTGARFDMGVRYAAGANGQRLMTAQVDAIDTALGMVALFVDGTVLAGLPGPMEIVELAYDLVCIQAGTRVPLLRGPLILTPGVS